MISTAIELHFDCRNCESPVHVNAMTPKVACSSCDHVTDFDWAAWQGVLEDSFDEIPDYAHGRGGRSQTFAGASANTDIVYSRFEPYCFSCKTDFDAAALVAANADGVTCAKCGDTWHARAPDAELAKAFPQIRYLFAEDPSMIPDAFGALPVAKHTAGAQPVVFACPACGGGLKVDGNDRMVPCEHCASSVYLPDDLWRRLHPVTTKRRWFIWWDDGDHTRDTSRFPTESESAVGDLSESSGPISAFAPPPAPPAVAVSRPSDGGVGKSGAARGQLALIFVAMGLLLLMGMGAAMYVMLQNEPERAPEPAPELADPPGHHSGSTH